MARCERGHTPACKRQKRQGTRKMKKTKKEAPENGREQIKISVRNLVEFILRSGDIDNRHGRTDTREAMRD